MSLTTKAKPKRKRKTRKKPQPKLKRGQTLLALDLSMTCTGWSYFVGSQLIDYGSISFKGMTDIEAFFALRDELSRISKVYERPGIEVVAYEDANMQKGVAGEQFATLRTSLKTWAHKLGIEVHKVYPQTVKKAATGSGRAEKHEVVAAVAERHGIDLDPEVKSPDGDIADSIGVAMALLP